MDTVTATIIVAVLGLVGTCVGAYYSNRKSTALFNYRLDELEKKVTLHNNMIDRVYALEEHSAVIDEKISVANHRISDLESK